MQWTAEENAGFTTGKHWLPVNENHSFINAQAALADPDSVFHYYRRLIELRKTYEVFRKGSFQLLLPEDPNIFAYLREVDGENLLVICNFTAQEQAVSGISVPENARLLLSNYAEDVKILRPYEAKMYFWQ
jgi:glycosidase